MADPSKPTVPDAPGVPPVNRFPEGTPSSVAPAASDGADIVATAPTLKWGIRTSDGEDYFPEDRGPDSFLGIEDSADWSIPNYPTEDGGFESYNKVTKPGEVQLTVAKGGTVAQRQGFRQQIDALAASTDLVTLLTPGRVYKGYTFTRVENSRTAETGAALLRLRLVFTQVRTTVQASFSNVASPSAAPNVSGGAVQPAAPSPSQTPPPAVAPKPPVSAPGRHTTSLVG